MRVLIAYCVAMFGTLQGLDVMVTRLELPGVLMRWAVLLAIGGLPVAAVLAALVAGIAWLAWRDQRYRRARSQLDEAVRLADEGKLAESLELAFKVEETLPSAPALRKLWPEVSRLIDIASNPPGAVVQARIYGAADSAWRRLGATPLSGARISVLPNQLRLTKPGYAVADRGQWRYGPYRVELAGELVRE